MAREYCNECHYLKKLCVCDLIPRLNQPLKIVIFQHPKEASHAKNTIKLVQLVWPEAKVILLPEDDVNNVSYFEGINENWHLLYPSDISMSLDTLTEPQKKRIEGLVLIDATWRKAFKLLNLYPVLQSLPRVCFGQLPKSLYSIRKAPSLEALSSLEALAYASELISSQEGKPLLDFMVQAQARLWQQRPKN